MSHVTLLGLVLFLRFVVWAVPPQTLAQSGPTCSISGVVTKSNTGDPVRGATVVAFRSLEQGDKFSTDTGEDGRFDFRELAPGKYFLGVAKSGVGLAYFGSSSMPRPIGLVECRSDAPIRNYTIKSIPPSIVSGQVRDQYGDPLGFANLELIRTSTRGKMRVQTAGKANADGTFRAVNVLPGKYILRASAPPSQAPGFEARENHDFVYVPTYYPGVVQASVAVVLEVKPGEEIRAEIQLVRARSISIRGKLNGWQAVMAGNVNLAGELSNAPPRVATVTPTGEFEFGALPPGRYTIHAIAWHTGDRKETEEGDADPTLNGQVTGEATIEAGEQGATVSIDLRPSPRPRKFPGTIRTAVVKVPQPSWAGVSVGLYDVTADKPAGAVSSLAEANEAGRFELEAVTPRSVLPVLHSPSHSLEDYYIQSIRCGGLDITVEGIGPDTAPCTLEFVLGLDGGLVEGVVLGSDGQAAPGAVVVAIPEGKFRRQYAMWLQGGTNQQGRFIFRGVRPMTYRIIVWEDPDPSDLGDAEFMLDAVNSGTVMEVSPNSHLNLKLSASPFTGH